MKGALVSEIGRKGKRGEGLKSALGLCQPASGSLGGVIMSRSFGALLCAAIVLQSFGAVAVAAPAVDGPSRAHDCAVRYNTAMHMDDTLAGLLRSLVPIMIGQMESQGGKKLSESEKSDLVEAMAESAAAMGPKLQDELIPAMLETFSEQELCALATFYETPAGQGVVAKMPGYSQAASGAMQKFIPLFQADMMVRICKRMGCDAAKMPTPQPS